MLFFVLLSGSLAHATNGMKVIGVGPVQRSMAGASVGLPLDSATTITNPAGMSIVDKQVDFGITYFDPDVSYSATSAFGQVTNNNQIMGSDASPSVIPAFGLICHKTDNWTFGLGAYGVSGMGVDYEKNLYNNVTYTKYTFMKFAPAVSFAVNESFSIGIAPNIDYATMDFEAGTTAEVAHHGGTSFGMGYTLGAFYQMNEILSIGLAYESKQYFKDFEFNTTSGKDKLDFDQPQSFALGLGIKPDEKIRVAFDIVWIDWPQTNGENKPAYTQNSSSATAWNLNWSDQYVYKLGAEYALNETWTLRAGYNYGKHPLDANRTFENISFPAIVEHHITWGAGVNLSEKLDLNLGFMYAPEVSLDTANASGQFINGANTKMSQLGADVGVSYKF